MAAKVASLGSLLPHAACFPAKPSPCLSGFRGSRCLLAATSSTPSIHLHHDAERRSHQQRQRSVKCCAAISQGEDAGAAEAAPVKFDVSSNCVQPVFRSSPWLLKQELATKNYNEGEPPDVRALEIANEKGLQLRSGHTAVVFDHRRDIMEYDLVLVMDKFNATDVLKEISVYDTIDKGGNYSSRVHRLGDFSPADSAVLDIDDPLYGNMGGPDELENLRTVYEQVRVSCTGLVEHLLHIRASLPEEGGESLKEGLAKSVKQMKNLEWMVPPMLQKR